MLRQDSGAETGQQKERPVRGRMVPATMSCLSTATLVLFSALGANGVPMGHARHLLVYDPSGIHLAILLMVIFTPLTFFCCFCSDSLLCLVRYGRVWLSCACGGIYASDKISPFPHAFCLLPSIPPCLALY